MRSKICRRLCSQGQSQRWQCDSIARRTISILSDVCANDILLFVVEDILKNSRDVFVILQHRIFTDQIVSSLDGAHRVAHFKLLPDGGQHGREVNFFGYRRRRDSLAILKILFAVRRNPFIAGKLSQQFYRLQTDIQSFLRLRDFGHARSGKRQTIGVTFEVVFLCIEALKLTTFLQKEFQFGQPFNDVGRFCENELFDSCSMQADFCRRR